MSRLWKQHDQLILFRPYMRDNLEEEGLFGSHRPVEGPHQAMAHSVVQRPDSSLFEFLPRGDLPFANYHLLYGSATVICKIESETPATAATTSASEASPSSLSVGERDGSVLARVLSLRHLPSPQVNSANLKPEEVVEIWLRLPPTAALPCPQLLRIRSLAREFCAMCAHTVGSCEGIQDIRVQAGQTVFISGGIEVVGRSTLEVIYRQDGGSAASPGGPLLELVQAFSGATAVLNCRFSSTQSNYSNNNFYQTANLGFVERENVGGASVSSGEDDDSLESRHKVVALCCLPALACSPSLLLPEPIKQAVAVSSASSMLGVAGGCVLVQASLQPMHPSVRLLPASTEGPVVGAEGRAKRQRVDADNLNEDGSQPFIHSGYQLV